MGLLALSKPHAKAATVGPTDRFIPLVVDGGGWSTQIALTNLAAKRANLVVTLSPEAGANERWSVELASTAGTVRTNTVEMELLPGASAIIETSGAAAESSRGFADLVELADQPIGAIATLTQRDGTKVIQSFQVPLAPAHERTSVVPIDLADKTRATRFVWVSLTSTTMLDIEFRNLAGERVATGQVSLDGKAQVTVDPLEQWPELAASGFRGTMKWTVSFPGADRYEPRILSALCLVSKEGLGWSAVPSMTLPTDQASANPYE